MDEIDEDIESNDRATIADFGAFDAERLGLAVDTLISGAPVVQWLINGQWLSRSTHMSIF